MWRGWAYGLRELVNVIERAAILAHNGVLTLSALTELVGPSPGSRRSSAPSFSLLRALPVREHLPRTIESERLDDVDRRHILAVLEATNWVVGGPGGAAARLGMK